MNLRWLILAMALNWVGMLLIALAFPNGWGFAIIFIIGGSLFLMVEGLKKLDPENYWD